MNILCRDPGRERIPLALALALVMAMTSAPPATAQNSSDEQQRQNKIRDAEQSRVYRPRPATSSADRDRKKQLEKAGTVQPQRTAVGSDAPLKDTQRTTPAMRAALIREFDWTTLFRTAGTPMNGLRLGLGMKDASYVYGTTFPLFIGLANRTDVERRLDRVLTHETLAQADDLVFRIESDAGPPLLVPNFYFDTETIHKHAPLVIGSNGTLRDFANFDVLVAGSADLFDLVQRSSSLRITAEIRSLTLRSNPITVRIAH